MEAYGPRNAQDRTWRIIDAVGVDAEGLSPTSGGAAYGGAISVSGGALKIAGSTLSRNSAVAGRGTHAIDFRGFQQPAADGGDAVGYKLGLPAIYAPVAQLDRAVPS